MKIHKLLFALLFALGLTGCSDDMDTVLTPEQQHLIGRAINFNVSKGDAFATRTTWDDTGSFNENDIMRIYRQYSTNGIWEEGAETYRTYYYKALYASDVIKLNTSWSVYEGRQGYNHVADALHPQGEFTQNKADSLTWENGNTIRFRAWSRSNYSGCISNNKDGYYPDFCIADYVNSSGPSEGIPLVLRHMGCRIVFDERDNGNEITRIEICADIKPDGTANADGWKDYMRPDNSDIKDNDNSDTEAGKTEDKAKEECTKVTEVYKRMCMPAGVDMSRQAIYAMPKTLWDSQNLNLNMLENSESQFIGFGTKTPDEIASEVVRPKFSSVNGLFYFITAPYDMSNAGTKGDILVLPPYTRFRIYLKDVNNGDQYNTPGYEADYHIFSLSDIKDASNNPKFPNGIELRPSYSYKFRVGYRYGALTVTAEDNFSWDQQEKEEKNMSDQHGQNDPLFTTGYTWWKEAIENAIPKGSEDFEPVFEISTKKEFMEFIALVNGTASNKTSDDPLRSKIIYHKNDDGTTTKEYKWYLNNEEDILGNDTTFHDQSYFESRGYIFYEHYRAANADRAAYSETDYLRGNYAFYDDDLKSHFKVNLTADIDFQDLAMYPVGYYSDKPFMGFLDGQGHKLINVNLGTTAPYIFNYTNGAAISNLRIESTHNVSLLNQGDNGTYILGVSLHTNTTGNSIAHTLNGTSFVVGCIHEGDGPQALVGSANNLFMYGCMNTSEDINGGALLGGYAQGANAFFAPQSASKPSWGRFMCNYYNKQTSPSANAVGSTTDSYNPLEYIRGSKTYILRAKNDMLLGSDVSWSALNDTQKEASYGLAPWKAMNYAIWKYNDQYGSTHKCTMHYESNTIGYDHRYPVLVSGQCANGTPAGIPDYSKINPITLNN